MNEELNTTTRTFPRTLAEAFDNKKWWHPHEPSRKEKTMTKRETIIAFLKDMLRPRTLQEMINIELRDAYLAKMNAENSLEYATSIVEYNRQRIRRLEEKLKELEKPNA